MQMLCPSTAPPSSVPGKGRIQPGVMEMQMVCRDQGAVCSFPADTGWRTLCACAFCPVVTAHDSPSFSFQTEASSAPAVKLNGAEKVLCFQVLNSL